MDDQLDQQSGESAAEGTLSAQPARPRVGVVAHPGDARAADDATGLLPEQASPLQPRRGDLAPLQNKTPVPAGRQSDSGGGSGFHVDPAQYQAAVSPMRAAADQISQLASSLTGFLGGLEGNSPWGNDDSGKKFAEGDQGYLKYSADTQKALQGLPDGLHFIADGLKAMAQGYQDAEDSAISSMSEQDDQLQQEATRMPRSPRIS